MRKTLAIFILSSLALSLIQAQEILIPLSGNPVLEKQKNDLKSAEQKSGEIKYLGLPFIDDFSEKGQIYPSSERWSDRYGYVNTSYGFNPPTLGVVTLDVLDDTGAVYPEATFSTFRADQLTSHFIRLDSAFDGTPRALSPEDSIFLSFWYQPQGFGNAPEQDDILELQFLEGWHVDTIVDTTTQPPYDTNFVDIWNTVWSAEGMPLELFTKDGQSMFRQAIIPVTDSIYFRKDFRFRFVSYGSLADNTLPSWQSNVDHWNIDYVYLDEDRSPDDIYVKDIAIMTPAYSLLNTYDVLPYSQYSANPERHMGDSMYLLITSLDSEVVINSFEYEIVDDMGNQVHYFDGGDYNLEPAYHDSVYQDQASSHWFPPVDFSYPTGSGDSISFFTYQYIEKVGAAGNIIQSNDTSFYEQQFRNYYAMDDGTAEAGYGLTPKNAQLAYRFILDHPDTLTDISFFFNPTASGANQQYFRLTVWADRNFRPGDVIYSQEGVRPVFTGDLNRFYTYHLDTEEPLIVSDTFYVGWIQTTDDNLNVGFDRHRNVQREIFFNTNNGQWFNSAFKGALLIRPVFGRYQTSSKGQAGNKEDLISIFPNPLVSNQINLALTRPIPGLESNGNISIYDMTGRKVIQTAWQEQLNLPSLRSGFYILRVRGEGLEEPVTIRFIVP